MNFFKFVAKWVTARPFKVMAFFIVTVALLVPGVANLEMATGNDTLIQTDTQVYQDNERLEKEFGGESVIMLHQANNLEELFSPYNLQRMQEIETTLKQYEEIYSVISPVTIIENMTAKQHEQSLFGVGGIIEGLGEMGSQLQTMEIDSPASPESVEQLPARSMGANKQLQSVEKELNQLGSKLNTFGENLLDIRDNLAQIESYSDVMVPSLPQEKETIEALIYEEDELRDVFSSVVVDEEYVLMNIRFNGGVDDATKNEIIDSIHEALSKQPFEGEKTLVSGKPVLDQAIQSSMMESVQKMMMLSVTIMIIILSIIFRVRWRLLPLVMVLFAVIGTVGFMGWLSIPLTMVSMAVFPILIGLGIDYAIQFHSRYADEMAQDENGGVESE
ncbi:MMPL family transporter [Bacillus shivajii]|uniref:MMPL family transporter n=1 Tax=Bacillus shivajii TaxID=1983719 RepID=UPI0021F58C18|nr:MMPL family transporter [Bacillus shivajii]